MFIEPFDSILIIANSPLFVNGFLKKIKKKQNLLGKDPV